MTPGGLHLDNIAARKKAVASSNLIQEFRFRQIPLLVGTRRGQVALPSAPWNHAHHVRRRGLDGIGRRRAIELGRVPALVVIVAPAVVPAEAARDHTAVIVFVASMEGVLAAAGVEPATRHTTRI